MRLESIEGIRNNLIINDSYNLDLDSLKIAFQFIGEYNKPKKSLILTDILDSNENSEELYSEVSELVNEQKFDKVFLIGEEISSFYKLFNSETFTFNNTNQFIESKTGEYICTQCGQDFTREEKQEIEQKRNKKRTL